MKKMYVRFNHGERDITVVVCNSTFQVAQCAEKINKNPEYTDVIMSLEMPTAYNRVLSFEEYMQEGN